MHDFIKTFVKLIEINDLKRIKSGEIDWPGQYSSSLNSSKEHGAGFGQLLSCLV